MDLGGALSSDQHHLRTTLVDVLMLVAGIKPGSVLLPDPVHDPELGLRARQSRLDAGAVQICLGESGVPPLASHAAGRERRPELRHQFRVPRLLFGTFHMPEGKLPEH